MLNAAMLAELSPEDLRDLLAKAASQDPAAFAAAAAENSAVKQKLKSEIGTGSPRVASFLDAVWRAVMVTDEMLGSLSIDRCDTDEETLNNVLATIDAGITGSQDACTFEYTTGDGRAHKVRLTALSEDYTASGILNKALTSVAAADAEGFGKVVDKYQKRLKTVRVDKATRAEYTAQYEAAVASRKAELETSAPAAPTPPGA